MRARLHALMELYNLRLHGKRLLVGFTFGSIVLLIVLHPLLTIVPIACYCIGIVILDTGEQL